MHGFIVKQTIDFVEFFLGERPENNPRRRRWATPVDDDSSSAHASTWVGSDIAVHDDKSTFHASTDSRSCGSPNEQVSAGHFSTSIAATSIHHGNVPCGHSVAHEVSSHAFTDHGSPLICGSKKTACITLQCK